MIIPIPKFLFGYFFIVIGLGWMAGEFLWMSGYPSAEGTVIEINQEQLNEKPVFRSTVEYHVGESAYRFPDNGTGNPPFHEIGEKVKVRYPPTEPEKGQIVTWIRSYGMAMIFVLVGVVLVIMQKILSFIYRLVIDAIRGQMNMPHNPQKM